MISLLRPSSSSFSRGPDDEEEDEEKEGRDDERAGKIPSVVRLQS
jgi:hypothetical protein